VCVHIGVPSVCAGGCTYAYFLYVSTYVYFYVCLYLIHAYTHARMFECMHVCMYVCTHVRSYACAMPVCRYGCMHCASVYSCIYVGMHTFYIINTLHHRCATHLTACFLQVLVRGSYPRSVILHETITVCNETCGRNDCVRCSDLFICCWHTSCYAHT